MENQLKMKFNNVPWCSINYITAEKTDNPLMMTLAQTKKTDNGDGDEHEQQRLT